MGKAEIGIVKQLKSFKVILSKKMKVEKMILYGSRARGDALKHSDVDVLLVSKYFQDVPFLERMYLSSKGWKYKPPLEMFCYTPQEFALKKKENSYMKMILKEGVTI
ncbi:nucleotidyltransferase domain-containing protein [Candidatus Woesearchaeota archaeon]|nr:nucleotidyltransferase domain-containing protein [Candidatus Woesearchaeota archaeon]